MEWGLPKFGIFIIALMHGQLQSVHFSHSVVSNSATPWTAACQASLSITNSRSLLKLMSIELLMPSNHIIFCCPLLLLPSIFPRIKVFSKESVLHIKWPKYWSSSISPSNECSAWFPLGLTGLISLHYSLSSKLLLCLIAVLSKIDVKKSDTREDHSQ